TAYYHASPYNPIKLCRKFNKYQHVGVSGWTLDSLLLKGNGLSLMRELLTLLNRQSDIRAHPIEAHLPVSI
ncbi:MAG: hypothetical protein WBN83_13480, partial [Desulfoprunum sp.]|uniref:hypothetical protein n=1 Tax=Desulfoprunum sp. TaxID=2020866 RepID=UPI003C75E916